MASACAGDENLGIGWFCCFSVCFCFLLILSMAFASLDDPVNVDLFRVAGADFRENLDLFRLDFEGH